MTSTQHRSFESVDARPKLQRSHTKSFLRRNSTVLPLMVMFLGLSACSEVVPGSEASSPTTSEPMGATVPNSAQGPCETIAEVCDGLDNNCDSQIDEGLIRPCMCGQQEIESSVCENGTWTECPDVATAEICDGLDNDCDSQIDEELTRPCMCGQEEIEPSVCNNGTWAECSELEESTVQFILPAANQGCAWGNDGNLDQVNGAVAARFEQRFEFTPPDGKIICSISLSAEHLAFEFDDEFLFGFNDVVLVTSLDFLGQFDVIDGLPRYNWERIRGIEHDNHAGGPVCIAGAESCQMPETQTVGEVDLAFSDALNQALMAEAHALERFEFLVVTTGDDNGDIDCRHSELPLTITYRHP